MSVSTPPLPSIFDTQSLAGLKGGLRKDDPQALRAAAQQFEAVFLQMVLKSMRAATPTQDGMFESQQTRFYQDLLDSQLSQVMSARGGTGLAAMIERQLSRADTLVAPDFEGGIPLTPPQRSLPLEQLQRSLPLPAERSLPAMPLEGSPVRPVLPATVTSAISAANAISVPTTTSAPAVPSASNAAVSPPQAFVANVWPQAVAASRETGVPAHFLVGHAALESGWGQSEPRFADGSPSYNLFGLKAGSNWQGAAVESTTTEYVNGVATQRVERFRAYGSYAEAFKDYAQLLAQSPRYAAVVGSRDAASFAQGLQRAGYATDPAYASKLERIINGPTLRQALIG